MHDSFLDDSLRNAPVPAGLCERLRAIPRDELRNMSDEELDSWLRGAGPATDLLDRCRRIARVRPNKLPLRKWAVAASLLLMVGLSYVASAAVFLLSTYNISPPGEPLFAAGEMSIAEPSLAADLELAALPLEPSAWFQVSTEILATPELPDAFAHQDTPFCGVRYEPWPSLPTSLLLTSTDRRWQLVGNPFPRRGYIDGALNSGAPLYQPRPRGHGAEPPNLAAYRLWQQSTGVHAEVVPGAASGLEVSRVPLDLDTASAAAAARAIRNGELPPPESVRVEDFLAAMEYGFSAPSSQPVALKTAAGPAPFGGAYGQLLQVAVHAPALQPAVRRPTWLTILLDASGSLRKGDMVESIRRALVHLPNQLLPGDRLSLVVLIHHEAKVLADHCKDQDFTSWRIACGRFEADGSDDLLSGLPVAYALATNGPSDEEPDPSANCARRVVLISDGGTALEEQVFVRVASALSGAAAEGLQLHTIDVGPGAKPDLQLARCAQAGGGQAHRAASTEEIGWALLAALSGQSQTVAADATLSVTFDPQVVAMYRLLGHESRTHLGEWTPAAAVSGIRSGQTSTALYELRLWPNQRETVAEARLRWRDPRGGESRETVRTVRRADFALSFKDSAPSLQTAAVAAEAAELLKQSYFADSGSWRNLLEIAREANPAVRDSAPWRDLIDLAEKAQRLKPVRAKQRP